ncbi:MAG: cysteine desulfurase-like protein [Alphaproteobacteria bacterium]|nr:MAG: cysteine desulfurase-like protein [Alphaproteobacteria bacterium]
MALDVEAVRAEFPALLITDGGRPRIYFDAPGGTQACRRAIDAMRHHLETGTANSGGAFATAVATDAMSEAAHQAMADLLGGDRSEIAFGQNMTSLTFALSRSLGRRWADKGGEIVVTRLDHDANVAPWLLLARDIGLEVKWLDFDPETGALRLDELPGLLGPNTRLVAVGGASNALGTLNPLEEIVRIVRANSDALVFVDAVQSVPHVLTDVRASGCDFLACSPYKFFGPHQGVLWGREALMEELEAYKVRPADSHPAAIRFETGTPSYEGQAATIGAVEHIASLGGEAGSRRDRIRAGMAAIQEHERALGERFLGGIAGLQRLRLYGPPTTQGRVPTFSVTVDGMTAREAAELLAERGIFAWSGNFYAKEAIDRLGLAASGGLLRIGFCHYSSEAEVDTLIEALAEL